MNRAIVPSCPAGSFLSAAVLACALVAATVARGGLDGESNTDGFNPAIEQYSMAEAQREIRVARQLGLNCYLIDSIYWSPADLWGPPLGGPPIRQPVGYESKQIGPDRWMYRPLYSEDIAAGEEAALPPGTVDLLPVPKDAPVRQAAPAARPKRPAPSDAAPGDFIPPDDNGKPARSGPREF